MKKSRGRTGVIWIDQLKSCAPSRSADTETLLTGYKSLVIKDKKIYIFSLSDNILRSKLTRKKSLCYPFTQLLSVSATFLHSTAEYRCVTAKSEKNSLSRCTLETDELLRCFTCTKPHASLLSACWPLDSNNMSPRSAPSLTVLSASGADELN